MASALIVKMFLLFLYYAFSVGWSMALNAFFSLFFLDVPVVNVVIFETVSVEQVFEDSS